MENTLKTINYITTKIPGIEPVELNVNTHFDRNYLPKGIEGYQRQYNIPDESVQETKVETTPTSKAETASTSEVETTPTSKVENPSNGKVYSDKKSFISDMTSAYENALEKAGLSKEYAQYLVAQDALESNWGQSSLSKEYNFGGVKALKEGIPFIEKQTFEYEDDGTGNKVKKTRTSKFRKFNSLEDYATYKINLLNNNRYNAFGGTTADFYDRIQKGGYSTSPTYANTLRQMHTTLLKYAKNGGVLPGKTDQLFNILKKLQYA